MTASDLTDDPAMDHGFPGATVVEDGITWLVRDDGSRAHLDPTMDGWWARHGTTAGLAVFSLLLAVAYWAAATLGGN